MGGKADTKRMSPAGAGPQTWRAKVKILKTKVYALSLAAKDRRLSWYAKGFAVSILGYVLSPIDPVPDFIPVIGSIDDLILRPAAITLLIKMIPREVMDEWRKHARSHHGSIQGKRRSAASIVVPTGLVSIYFNGRLVSSFSYEKKGHHHDNNEFPPLTPVSSRGQVLPSPKGRRDKVTQKQIALGNLSLERR